MWPSNSGYAKGDLQALPIDDGACDAALMILALTYVSEPTVALAEMARILKPGGLTVVVDLLPHDREDFRRQMEQQWMGFEPEQLRRMMSEAGFASPRVRPLSPEPGAKGPALFLATGARA
jgi:ArsR family transcriptional regulator